VETGFSRKAGDHQRNAGMPDQPRLVSGQLHGDAQTQNKAWLNPLFTLTTKSQVWDGGDGL
jgi:hypothetical protein